MKKKSKLAEKAKETCTSLNSTLVIRYNDLSNEIQSAKEKEKKYEVQMKLTGEMKSEMDVMRIETMALLESIEIKDNNTEDYEL